MPFRKNIRKKIKSLLYGKCPGFAGRFPYFGCKVYFPPDSLIFSLVCEQGIFEAENMRMLVTLARPGSYYLDVGANIGLMSLPVLQAISDIRVVSFEPSPNVLTYLTRTITESPHHNRWELVPKAVGEKVGKVTFSLSSRKNSVFDGIKSTHRVPAVGQVEVEITTLDQWWHQAGKPDISLIKCDVEGAELQVLQGAKACLTSQRPYMLLEWNKENLAAYDCKSVALFHFAVEMHYQIFALPNLVEIQSELELTLHMTVTENFLLSPKQI